MLPPRRLTFHGKIYDLVPYARFFFTITLRAFALVLNWELLKRNGRDNTMFLNSEKP